MKYITLLNRASSEVAVKGGGGGVPLYYSEIHIFIVAFHLLTNPRTALREFFRNGPRHKVSNKTDNLKCTIKNNILPNRV